MSVLSLIQQFPIISLPTSAGSAGTGVLDEVFSAVIPAGTYIGSVSVTIAGAGVTSGSLQVSYDNVAIGTSVIGAVGASPTATCTFFFQSNGSDLLSVDVIGNGANWTSGASAVVLRQIA